MWGFFRFMQLVMKQPSKLNHFQTKHANLLMHSYQRFTGRALLAEADAKSLYHAPFPVLSHNTADDPILTYGNLAAQRLWEMDWEALTQLPSRLTAEPMHRDQRSDMFEQMRTKGWIANYEGIRISATGKRFRIKNAIIWTVTDRAGQRIGEAATFKDYTPL